MVLESTKIKSKLDSWFKTKIFQYFTLLSPLKKIAKPKHNCNLCRKHLGTASSSLAVLKTSLVVVVCVSVYHNSVTGGNDDGGRIEIKITTIFSLKIAICRFFVERERVENGSDATQHHRFGGRNLQTNPMEFYICQFGFNSIDDLRSVVN